MDLIDAQSVAYQFIGTPMADLKVKLLGIRGFFSPANQTGVYDDLICSIVDGKVSSFRGSTDPGAYYINHPLSPLGCAKLQLGVWQYQLGLHRNTNPALVQAEPFKVDRIDCKGVTQSWERGYFGINIHSGGDEIEVGRYSAGCQIVFSKEGSWGATWHQFYDPVRAAMRAFDQDVVPYKLIEHPKAMPASLNPAKPS